MNTFENINTLFKAFTDKFGPIVSKRCHEFTPDDFEQFANLLDKYCEVKDEAASAVKPTDTVTPTNTTVPNKTVEPVEDPIKVKNRLHQTRPAWLKLNTLVTYTHNDNIFVGKINDIREYINIKKQVAKFYVNVTWLNKPEIECDTDNKKSVFDIPNVFEAHQLMPVFGRGNIITPENVEQLCMHLLHSPIRLANNIEVGNAKYHSGSTSTQIATITEVEYILNNKTCDVDNFLINGYYLEMLLEYDPYIHIDGVHWEKLMNYIMWRQENCKNPTVN